MEQPSRYNRLVGKYGPAYKWLAVSSVILGLLTTIFSSTMVNVALTDIMEDYSITQGSAQWMATAFLCANAVMMLTTAWLTREIGARLTFMAAIFLFLAGSALGWAAPNYPLLILARLLQGAGAGILQPLSMSLVFILFPPDMRGRAMGLFGMGVVIGPAIGPVVGGIITDTLDWHMTFAISLPLAMVAGILGWIFLPDRRQDFRHQAFNWLSFIIIGVTVGSLLIGLTNSQFDTLTSVQVYPYFILSLTGLLLFLVRETRSKAPLVQLEVFRNPVFTSTAIIGALVSAGLFSSIYAIPLFVRTVQGMNATDAGLILLPAGLTLVAVFPIAGRLVDMFPAYRMIIAGLLTFLIATYALSFAHETSDFWVLACWVLIGRVALGFVMPANSTLALSRVQQDLITQASGSLNFVRMLGGTVGVNLTAILITARSSFHLEETAQKYGVSLLTEAQRIEAETQTFQDCFLITLLVFSLSLIPGLYIAIRTERDRKKEEPRQT
ncbi:MDR family MFS transporter [Sneathiella chinensis]|uniref:Multidrug MFS transporter n=1 Tax=Sneathiella chinensis TaxID=349750 RepID=A0ABQ5U688_9PROT|nr:MDR family MFS transporter [Sneathiella chinensis]GLQ06685.1 multidrug MFS transporter [Sneathiella chinensis]